MIWRNTIVTLVLALAASAGGQTVGSPADALEFPAEGVLTGTNVYIRSQAMSEAYTCGKISRPASVTVIGREGEWLKIIPPEGVFSVISKSYVRREAEDWGTVTGERVLVRAGSSPLLADTEAHYAAQGHLNTRDTVRIVGEGGDFYKIAPPGGAYVWVWARYVQLPGQEPVEPPSGDVVVETVDEGALETGEPADPAMTEAGRQFLAVDDMLIAELEKPKLEQNLRAVLAAYKAIDVPAGSAMSGAIDRRIAYVESAIELQNDAVEVEELAARTHRRQAELERRLARGGLGVAGEGVSGPYDAWGVLSASASYPGGATGKRFLLRDPDTNEATAYARDPGGRAGLAAYEGRLVGVQGRVIYEAQTGMSIVDVTRVTPLEPVAPAPARAPEPPAERVSPEPAAGPVQALPARTEVPVVPPAAREPISLEPDQPLAPSPPSSGAEPDAPVSPAAETETSAPRVERDTPAVPEEPVRPSRLIRPEPESEDTSEIPEPPDRPPRPSRDGPPIPSGESVRAQPAPKPPAEDAGSPEPPAEEDEDEPPAKPAVEIRRPLPPPGLPIEDEPSKDGPGIDTREYE